MSSTAVNVDQDALDAIFDEHSDLILNLAQYESVSRSNAASGRGLLHLLPLLQACLGLSGGACNLKMTQMRESILAANSKKPLNKSKLSNNSWAGALFLFSLSFF